MNSKHFLFLIVSIFLVTLIACSKDTDGFYLDSDSAKSTTARGANELRISYDMDASQNIKPINGTIKDLCAMDIKIMTIPSTTTSVNTSIGPNGQACMEMVERPLWGPKENVGKPTNGNGRPGRPGGTGGKPTTTKYCNGVLTFTDTDGSVTTIETAIDNDMLQSIYENYVYTESQQDSVMNVMIKDAEKSGAKVTQNGNALTILEVDADGNTTTTVYDIKNHVIVSTSTVDGNGNILSKTTLTYKCTEDGKIVPDSVISYNYNDNMVCSDPVYNVEQIQFKNFKISI